MAKPPKGTPAARKAVAAYAKRRREAGEKKVTVWMTTPTRVDLELLKARHGSNDKAIAAALAAAVKALPHP